MTRLLGLDLGGTNVKWAVVDAGPDGASGAIVVATGSEPTMAGDGPPAVVARLGRIGREAAAAHGPIAAAGVGVPGLFDSTTGTIELFPNLPGPWKGQAVRDPLSGVLGVPVSMINDARAMTLAEVRLGAAAGSETAVFVVLGTGVGGGVVVDGRLRFGPHGRAGELGHQVVVPGGPPCGCGNHGCLESVARAGALAERGGQPTAEEVVVAARAGDRRAAQAIAEVADYLGHGLANLVTVLLPERVVVGGGVAAAGDLLFDPLRAAIARRAVLVPPDWYEVVPAEMGPFAGAIGAALWPAEPP